MSDLFSAALQGLTSSTGPFLVGGVFLGAVSLLLIHVIRRGGAAAQARLDDMARLQAETTVRLQTMAEIFTARHADLARSLGERIDGLGHRVGSNLHQANQSAAEQLERLAERLAIIDKAQKSLGDLAGEVLSLRQILANKQARGAFGQGRMEAIVQDGLPSGSYDFQATLSNKNRPDCLVNMPNGAPPLVIDAKFPLEAFERWRTAGDEKTADECAREAKRNLTKHILDVRERYFIPGETQDTALIFVPSESLFADIHERLPEVVDRATRARILLVSPSLLMLSIQLVQAVLRDVRMREQAHLIQNEVRYLIEDVNRLQERTLNLKKHFGQASTDVEQILTSAEKIVRRGGRIDDVVLEDDRAAARDARPHLEHFPAK